MFLGRLSFSLPKLDPAYQNELESLLLEEIPDRIASTINSAAMVIFFLSLFFVYIPSSKEGEFLMKEDE